MLRKKDPIFQYSIIPSFPPCRGPVKSEAKWLVPRSEVDIPFSDGNINMFIQTVWKTGILARRHEMIYLKLA
jgi:hypothetical protein